MSIGNYTDNYSVPLSNFDTATWIDEDWARWRMLDALIASVDDSDIPIVLATGAANTFVATYTPVVAAYALGLTLQFIANNAVTGASTINVNGLGAKALKINGAATVTGDIPVNSYVKIIYNGTDFSVVDPKRPVNANQNVITGSSGATPNASTDFYVETAGPSYVELLGPNASTQGYMFSRPALSYAGGIKYDHVNQQLNFRIEGSDVVSIDDLGNVSATSFIGPLTGNVTGNLTGAVTGNATTATTWANSRTLTLSTDASGSIAFNGSANFTLALTIVPNAITTSKIIDDAVTNAKLAEVATATIKGRTTAGTGNPEDLTGLQVAAMLGFAGAVVPFAMATVPAGWLECNGAAVSRTTYATLFAAISTTWGVGDGSTTFNLPDLRGEFVRGWDNAKGTDSGRAFASYQADEFEAHTHSTVGGNNATGGASATVQSNTASPGIATSSAGGAAETRPRNYALMYCIKI